MKTAFVLAAISGLAAAANSLPACAVTCLEKNLPKLGCTVGDLACMCKPETQSKLVGVVGPCMMESCSRDEIMQAQSASGTVCLAYSPKANAPTEAPKPTSAAPSAPVYSSSADNAAPAKPTSSAVNDYAPPSAAPPAPPAPSAPSAPSAPASSSDYGSGGGNLNTAPASTLDSSNYVVPTPSASGSSSDYGSNSTGAGPYTTPISYASAGSAAGPAAVGLLAIFAAAIAL